MATPSPAPRPDDLAAETPPLDPHMAPLMGWVMPLWLACFLLVAVFGVVSYLFGWWFQKG
jgi:hypothetical protein